MAGLQAFSGGLAMLILSLGFLDCLEPGSLSDFIPRAVGLSGRTLGSPGSLIAILTLPGSVILSTDEREPGCLAGVSGVRAAGLPPSSLCSPRGLAALALWTRAWNPDLIQPPGPLGRAGSKLAESTHSQQDPEPETAGDGGEVTVARQARGVSVWDFPRQPRPWRGCRPRGGYRAVSGTDLAPKGGSLCLLGAGLGGAKAGEGEEEGAVLKTLWDPGAQRGQASGQNHAKASGRAGGLVPIPCLGAAPRPPREPGLVGTASRPLEEGGSGVTLGTGAASHHTRSRWPHQGAEPRGAGRGGQSVVTL